MIKINFDKITESWQKNLIDEYQILDEHVLNLTTALNSADFKKKVGETQYELMVNQLKAMNEYETIIEDRLIDLGLATRK